VHSDEPFPNDDSAPEGSLVMKDFRSRRASRSLLLLLGVVWEEPKSKIVDMTRKKSSRQTYQILILSSIYMSARRGTHYKADDISSEILDTNKNSRKETRCHTYIPTERN